VCRSCHRHLGFGFGGARFVAAAASTAVVHKHKGPVSSKASRGEGDGKKVLLGPAPGANLA
jgi:hypothetical protein